LDKKRQISAAKRRIPCLDSAVKTQIPRLTSKFHGLQKTVGPSDQVQT